jgi:hypothetical protein
MGGFHFAEELLVHVDEAGLCGLRDADRAAKKRVQFVAACVMVVMAVVVVEIVVLVKELVEVDANLVEAVVELTDVVDHVAELGGRGGGRCDKTFRFKK